MERATAWDLHALGTVGREVVARFLAALDAVAGKVLASLDRLEPATWAEAVDGLQVVARMVSPEVLAALVGQEWEEEGPAPELHLNSTLADG